MNASRNAIAVAAILASGAAYAQYTDGVIKIGVLTDMLRIPTKADSHSDRKRTVIPIDCGQ